MQDSLSGEVALVTGASRGIGRAIALKLARLGADVGLVQRGDAAETAGAIDALGRRVLVVRADLSDPSAADAAVDEIADALGRLDVAVASAGVIQRGPALEAPLDEWRRVIDTNLTSVFALSRASARRFLAQGEGGCIVHIASVLSFQGGINVSSYAAAKGGIAQLTQALANEWAALGVRVNAVAPGYVETEMTGPLLNDPVRFGQITARIPAGRWATPDEVAEAVAFLVSPAAAYIHGHVLAVDGGWLGR